MFRRGNSSLYKNLSQNANCFEEGYTRGNWFYLKKVKLDEFTFTSPSASSVMLANKPNFEKDTSFQNEKDQSMTSDLNDSFQKLDPHNESNPEFFDLEL